MRLQDFTGNKSVTPVTTVAVYAKIMVAANTNQFANAVHFLAANIAHLNMARGLFGCFASPRSLWERRSSCNNFQYHSTI